MKVDHVGIIVDDPPTAAEWYASRYGAKIIYADPTWAFIQFDNIKIAFVTKDQHPPHIAFEVSADEIISGKKHRDGSISSYGKDPWGNFIEKIKYPKEKENG